MSLSVLSKTRTPCRGNSVGLFFASTFPRSHIVTDSLKLILAQVDAQIAAQKLKPEPGLDRRQRNDPLPEGMENRRKLADRRKSRLATTEKELE